MRYAVEISLVFDQALRASMKKDAHAYQLMISRAFATRLPA